MKAYIDLSQSKKLAEILPLESARMGVFVEYDYGDGVKRATKFHCVNVCPIVITDMLTLNNEASMFDWLNKKMLDYRGLIPMGLGIDCTNLNIY